MPAHAHNHREYVARYRKEWQDPIIWRNFLVEFIATFYLASIQCATVLSYGDPLNATPTKNGLAMGLTVMVMVDSLGPLSLSGVQMNPAVTFGMMLCLRMTVVKGLCYISIQICAALAGAALIYALTPETRRETLGVNVVHPDVRQWQACIWEMWITALLVFAVLGTKDKPRKPKYFNSALYIGVSVSVAGFCAAEPTGCGLNPALALGPAVMMQIWLHHWIYWIGPLSGSAIATFIYVVVLDYPDRHSVKLRLEAANMAKAKKLRNDIIKAMLAYQTHTKSGDRDEHDDHVSLTDTCHKRQDGGLN